jgi:ABC-type Na+ efflux pump permease subunit
MLKRKRIKFIIIVTIIIAFIILIINLIQGAFSKYKSSAIVVGNGTIAYWAITDSLATENISLTDLAPSSEPKVYDISISNFDDNENIAETAMTYELTINATTYLPLTYKLYKKEASSYVLVDEEDIFQDTDGSYMKKLTYTGKFELNNGNVTKQTSEFKLKVYFPTTYKTNTEYIDLIDYIEVKFDSKQILASDVDSDEEQI